VLRHPPIVAIRAQSELDVVGSHLGAKVRLGHSVALAVEPLAKLLDQKAELLPELAVTEAASEHST
jgi:hypothetical protein